MVKTKEIIQLLRKNSIQIFLFVNLLFVIKHLPRAEVNPVVSFAIYLIFVLITPVLIIIQEGGKTFSYADR
jgi:hypothetical protein